MGQTGIFLITTGDIQVLPKFLKAADAYQKAPPDEVMDAILIAVTNRPHSTLNHIQVLKK